MKLGIDFGTTRTVAASAEDGNYPVCTFSWGGEFKEYIPSLVAVKNGVLRFGWDAVRCLEEPQIPVLRSMKRLTAGFRPDEPVDLAPGVAPSMLELLTLFLRHVRHMVARRSNLSFGRRRRVEAMIAVPANANNNQRYLTLEAFRGAGFSVLGMVNEPSAAAFEFVHRYLRDLGPRSPKRYVVVYDLGGGTFDTSAVGLGDRGYEVIACEGVARLGGDDFDEVILELALAELGLSRGSLNRDQETRLLEECRERKEGLKANTRKMVVDPGSVLGEERTAVLDTGEIYARCEPLIQGTVDAVQAVTARLTGIGIDPEDPRTLAAVYLVGGSVAFPPVSRMIRQVYDRKVKVSPFPHAATAIGLAIAAQEGHRIRLQEPVSRNFGVWREQTQGRDKVFDVIFQKDRCPAPGEERPTATRVYHPVHNVGHLRYLECSALGENGEPQGDITPWREIRFPYDPELRARKDLAGVAVEEQSRLAGQEVIESYLYDRGGIVRVEIENRTAGYRRAFVLEP